MRGMSRLVVYFLLHGACSLFYGILLLSTKAYIYTLLLIK